MLYLIQRDNLENRRDEFEKRFKLTAKRLAGALEYAIILRADSLLGKGGKYVRSFKMVNH